MKSDIEIANEIIPLSMEVLAKKLGIDTKYIVPYGKNKAKIDISGLASIHKEDGKLILVTSMNPTPYGEGKTTISIGLDDALCKLGYHSIVTLREPSLGPVFGMKGGATGGGFAQVIPMEDINLHFTGDIHAVTTCNNLLCAIVDNHIFQGNPLEIDSNEIYIKRCLDMNDRALREVTLKGGRKEHFQITTASEIMAILCLSRDMDDLRNRLSNILIGKNSKGEPVFARDLHCIDALMITLKDAIMPNLVQTLEGNPAIIHGGPFANIAHGCNSIIATNLSLKLADYVVTEAGFGADLGAFKFLDIKGRTIHKIPDAIVMNVTARAIRYNGNGNLEAGLENVKVHIENLQKYTSNIVVSINAFIEDDKRDYQIIKDYVQKLGCKASIVEAYEHGGEGATELAQEVVELCKTGSVYKELYDLKKPLQEKIHFVCNSIFRASSIKYTDKALEKIKELETWGLTEYPLCIAKTQYSLGDDAKKINVTCNHTMTVTDVSLSAGAGFIIIYMGGIMTMPGLSKASAYLDMHIDDEFHITGMR